MGQTRTPLKILVLPPVDSWVEELDALRAQGHTMLRAEEAMDDRPDLIIGAAAWYMAKAHRGLLDKAVAAAQQRVKGRAK